MHAYYELPLDAISMKSFESYEAADGTGVEEQLMGAYDNFVGIVRLTKLSGLWGHVCGGRRAARDKKALRKTRYSYGPETNTRPRSRARIFIYETRHDLLHPVTFIASK